MSLLLSQLTRDRDHLSWGDCFATPYYEGIDNLSIVAEAAIKAFKQRIKPQNDYQNLTFTKGAKHFFTGFLLLVPLINSAALFVLHSHYRRHAPLALAAPAAMPVVAARALVKKEHPRVCQLFVKREDHISEVVAVIKKVKIDCPEDLVRLIFDFCYDSTATIHIEVPASYVGKMFFNAIALKMSGQVQHCRDINKIWLREMRTLPICSFQEAWKGYESAKDQYDGGHVNLDEFIGEKEAAHAHDFRKPEKVCFCRSCLE